MTVEVDSVWGLLDRLSHFLLTRPSESTPLAAIILVPVASLAFYAFRHRGHFKRFRLARVLRVVLSRRYLGHRSHVLDVLLMAGNISVFAIIIGQATLSMTAVSSGILNLLTTVLWTNGATSLGNLAVGGIWGVSLFLAYELAYWLDHYLSHNVPVLWEFHKVHHSAEVLSPLTNFRVHPVDSLVFVNIVALCNGLTTGVLHWIFNAGPVQLDFFNATVLIGLAVTVFAQLQHTHIWISLTGIAGRLILSPAHHQIHHSVDPTHHNRNLGNLLAIFDWAFGTLHVPARQRQKLVFGLNPRQAPKHDLNEGLMVPFIDAGRLALPPSPAIDVKPT
jgi:sterol desaturase/sphingolipid hydroxylase (fatty acid hydroxylase superfamily)